MKRAELDYQIDRLREQIKGMKRRTVEYHAATARLQSYVTDRMRRDENARRNAKRKIAA